MGLEVANRFGNLFPLKSEYFTLCDKKCFLFLLASRSVKPAESKNRNLFMILINYSLKKEVELIY